MPSMSDEPQQYLLATTTTHTTHRGMTIMNSKILATALVLGLGATSLVGLTAAHAAPIAPPAISAPAHIEKVGYFLPNGVYVETCVRGIVGYDFRGWPIYGPVCG